MTDGKLDGKDDDSDDDDDGYDGWKAVCILSPYPLSFFFLYTYVFLFLIAFRRNPLLFLLGPNLVQWTTLDHVWTTFLVQSFRWNSNVFTCLDHVDHVFST